MNKYLSLLTQASIAALAFAAQPALAQEVTPQAAEDTNPSNDIIVTANKREQSVNDVGLTISAASGADLANRGVRGPEDLGKLVPGFTFTQSLYSTPVYTLRGIGLYDATFGASPSVAVYSDQIPRNVPTMSDALDLDVERVEVLKGPQGTLFGAKCDWRRGQLRPRQANPRTPGGLRSLLRAFRSLRSQRLR